jgi:hypothetical protein
MEWRGLACAFLQIKSSQVIIPYLEGEGHRVECHVSISRMQGGSGGQVKSSLTSRVRGALALSTLICRVSPHTGSRLLSITLVWALVPARPPATSSGARVGEHKRGTRDGLDQGWEWRLAHLPPNTA